MNMRFRLRVGEAEVEYEGPQEFLSTEFAGVMDSILGRLDSVKATANTKGEPASEPKATGPKAAKIEGTGNTLASRLGVKTGPELIIAVAARLTFVLGKDKFARKDITDEMREASTYFRATYMNNLTSYLEGLVKGNKLSEQAKDVYALTAPERDRLEAELLRVQS